jgi:hypothetical protein
MWSYPLKLTHFLSTAKPAYSMPKPAEGTTLFVRNLLFESEEEHLKEL